MSLEQWLRNTWLQRHDPTPPEIEQLLQVVDRELSDARAVGISADGCAPRRQLFCSERRVASQANDRVVAVYPGRRLAGNYGVS
jgi:hypothetical protein